jgi:hypothetical protein
MYISFTSDGSVTGTGFGATYVATSAGMLAFTTISFLINTLVLLCMRHLQCRARA